MESLGCILFDWNIAIITFLRIFHVPGQVVWLRGDCAAIIAAYLACKQKSSSYFYLLPFPVIAPAIILGQSCRDVLPILWIATHSDIPGMNFGFYYCPIQRAIKPTVLNTMAGWKYGNAKATALIFVFFLFIYSCEKETKRLFFSLFMLYIASFLPWVFFVVTIKSRNSHLGCLSV